MRNVRLARIACKKRSRKAVSTVIGGIIILAILFSISLGYFYSINNSQQVYQGIVRQNNIFAQQRGEENIYIVGSASGGTLSFSVNNTGISATLVSLFVTDQNGKVDLYKSGAAKSATACAATDASIPCALNQGGSTDFSTSLVYSGGTVYTIKVTTARGNVFVGTYPTQLLTSYSVSSQLALGLGSLEMSFSSFTFYGYSQENGPWTVNLSSPLAANISPYKRHIVFSAQVTNIDPAVGTIVVNSHTDLWTFVSCASGCGSESLLFFYVMNVLPNGTITSTTQGSYVPIEIPYGVTKTIYFGSANDLSLDNYAAQSINDNVGEHDVFMIFSGTMVSAKNATLYAQNLPFAATFVADNLATWTQTPKSCPQGQSTTFSQTITNTQWSVSGGSNGINEVKIEAGAFSSISAISQPSGWNTATVYPNGTIIWTSNGNGNAIHAGTSGTFSWSGVAPSVTTGTQYVFPSTVMFNNGQVISQPIDTGCFVS
ncbi:MAG: hypothetical protein JRN52_00040 [Nitrososphaerota archaeon]|nr:hypothetical protein [Nitrososphaerota archaeon]